MRFKQILFLISLFGTGYSQNYVPVHLDSNYVWIQNVNANGGGNNCSHTIQMKVCRTKSFSNISYQYISDFGNALSSGNTNDCILNTKSSGFVRQDTLQQRIWLYDSIQNTEKLLYDFSQNVGDTAKHVYWFSPAQCAIVSGTSSVLLQDGINHKIITYTVSNVMSFAVSYAIEGVGYSAGFFDPYYPVQNPIYKSLNCYGKIINGNQTLQTVYGNNCNLLSFVPEKSVNDIKIFPNPFDEKLVIETREDLTIKIKDQLGLTVAEKNIDANSNEMLIAGLPAGIYYLHFSGRRSGVVKIIKR